MSINYCVYTDFFPVSTISSLSILPSLITTISTSTTKVFPTRIAVFIVFQEKVNDKGDFEWWIINEYTTNITNIYNMSPDIETPLDLAPDYNFIYLDTTIGPFTSYGIDSCISVVQKVLAFQTINQANVIEHVVSICRSHEQALLNRFDEPKLDDQLLFSNLILRPNIVVKILI